MRWGGVSDGVGDFVGDGSGVLQAFVSKHEILYRNMELESRNAEVVDCRRSTLR